MHPDPWLDRWLELICRHAGKGPVLEIGCGFGDDTAVLEQAGLNVIAFDLSQDAVAEARRRAPKSRIETRDIRDPFPPDASDCPVIIASLSLHYFPWQETRAVFARIRTTLRQGGLFIARLNSTEDHHYGASGHPEIEPDYFLVDGQPKRFFDRPAIETLLAHGWRTLALEHFVTDKYAKPKALWEFLAVRCGDGQP